MYKIWSKLSQAEIKSRIEKALSKNVNFQEENILGVPASHLDEKVFSQDASFVENAPFIKSLIQNPNHIGCHTIGSSESFFAGTQELEREVIDICAIDILKSKRNKHDGYIASGGTEANLQAIWIYRNYFIKEKGATLDEIVIICSEDRHYSMDKASNIFCIDFEKISVDFDTRKISKESVSKTIKKSMQTGKKYFIVIGNMMTTMFGSVDNIDTYVTVLKEHKCTYKLHIDGAFGGFYYPFANKTSKLTFENPEISSFTLDAHKMAQAPYGTGVFLIRKGYMDYATTKAASYVEGQDSTLIGSRSGANAISVWMILMKHGPFGWQEKIFILQKRAEWICEQLNIKGIKHYTEENSNIITIDSNFCDKETATKYGLVPDQHENPKWYKIVVMQHVTIEKLQPLLLELQH